MDLSLLNNDIFYNILSRLPANVLVQLKTVSKGWKHFIEDLDFMNLQLKVAQPISISGYFFQEKFKYCDIDVEKLSYIPVEAKETRIYRKVLDFLPEKVTILGSSNGLICCRSCLPSSYPLIYICNPVNKQWMTVKWDRIMKRDYIAFDFDPASTSAFNQTTGYKLVRLFEVDEFTPDSLCSNKQVFVKGALYWLTDSHIAVMFDVEKELSLLISLPIPFTEGEKSTEVCLGEFKGKLYCVVVSQEALMVWSLEDHFSSEWDLKSFMSFDVIEEANRHYVQNLAARVAASFGEDISWMQPLAFKDGMVFLRVSNDAYSFDIHTGKMRFLCEMLDLGQGLGPTVIPFSVSLASVDN